MTNVYEEIKAERDYQRSRWGDEADQTLNSPNDFIAYIAQYSSKWHEGTFPPYSSETVDQFRKHMVKVATLAVAAIEALDTQRAESGRAFYEGASA